MGKDSKWSVVSLQSAENKNLKARGPQTIHKNPYNFEKLDLCMGYSSDRCTEGAQCTESNEACFTQCTECTSVGRKIHALPVTRRGRNFQVKYSFLSSEF
jgi:hypothetical protein